MISVRSLNKVMLIGNITRDAEIRYTPKGTAVCGFSIATNHMWKDASGNKQEEATFHRISAWGPRGENLAKLLKKGMKVYVEGSLSYNDKKDEQGKIIARQADIRADEVVILESIRRDGDTMSGGPAKSADQPLPEDTDAGVAVDKIDIDSIMEQMDGATEQKETKGKKAKEEIADDLPF